MSVLLVRHAKAGSRRDWKGPDEIRPLSAKGRRQAQALADLLADRPIGTVLSSPFLRCVQTVQPLADKLVVAVRPAEPLAEGASAEEAVELMRGLSGTDAVLCTHGDMIPRILDSLAADDGLSLPPDYPCAKGSAWELTGDERRFVSSRYLPPPR